MSEGKSILLVENNPEDSALLRLAFHQVEVENAVIVIGSEEEAKEYLQRQTEGDNALPVLLVLGLRLEPIMGFPLLRWIRSLPALCAMPVFVLSGVGMSQEECKAHGLGSDCYAKKPITFKDLIKIAQLLRDRWIAPQSRRPA